MPPLSHPLTLSEKPTVTFQTQVKPYSKKELSHLYGITVRCLSNWLAPFKKEIGKRQGRYYNVLQVETIFAKLGAPYTEIEK